MKKGDLYFAEKSKKMLLHRVDLEGHLIVEFVPILIIEKLDHLIEAFETRARGKIDFWQRATLSILAPAVSH